jgi:hypothetical protein
MGCPWLCTCLLQGARSFSPSLSVLFLSLCLFIFVISCIACLDSHLSKISYQLQPDSGSPFGSFILYLLVNKIRVLVHLWMRQLIVVEGFHYLWFDFWHITIVCWNFSEGWHSCTDCEVIIVFPFCCLSPITQVLIIGVFLMLCVHVIPWKNIG